MKHSFVDPVCGMRLETDKISAVHEGVRYAFCSPHCQAEFVANPASYLGRTPGSSKPEPKRGCCG